MQFSIRIARLEDVPILEQLIAHSARVLGRADYTEAQIEAALHGAWGVHTELIRDHTYCVVEANGEIVACGGWSRRRTLFGSDQRADRESALLDPVMDAARIRAFFVRPDWARRGIGKALLSHCEAAARAEGFHAFQLMATLPGVSLYQSFGYIADSPIEYSVGDDLSIAFVPMRKDQTDIICEGQSELKAQTKKVR